AKLRGVEVLADPGAERVDDVAELVVLEHLLERGLLGVEYLAAQREDRLRLAVASLLRGAPGAVSFHDEELADRGVGRAAIGELARQVEAAVHRRLAPHLLGRVTRR